MPKKEKKDGEPSPWKDSQAKMLLQQDILNGKVTSAMKPMEVYMMRPEYKAYDKINFGNNLRCLRNSLEQNQAKADSDSAALMHDHHIHPKAANMPKGYPWWDGLAARQLLKQDIDAGLMKKLKPSKLHGTQPEYQAFPLKVFHDHIHQEVQSHLRKGYWMNLQHMKK